MMSYILKEFNEDKDYKEYSGINEANFIIPDFIDWKLMDTY